MRQIAPDVTVWLAAGEPVALATVVWTDGPSLRPVGSRMAVSASGRMSGSVSGGCVEGAVVAAAQEILSGAPPRRLRYSVVGDEDFAVGLACGGTVEIYVEPLREIHRRLLEALANEETVGLATALDGSGHLLAYPDGRREGDESLWSAFSLLFPGPASRLEHTPRGDLFLETFTPPPTLIIVGAVHIAQTLVTLARAVGFRTVVVDARRAFATGERFPQTDELLAGWPQQLLRPEELGPHDYVVILTHDPKFDLPALENALRSRAAYIGLLGSRVTQARRRAALREMGFDDSDLARIHGPVGLNLGGKEPGEIALEILAEIVAVRHGIDPDNPTPRGRGKT